MYFWHPQYYIFNAVFVLSLNVCICFGTLCIFPDYFSTTFYRLKSQSHINTLRHKKHNLKKIYFFLNCKSNMRRFFLSGSNRDDAPYLSKSTLTVREVFNVLLLKEPCWTLQVLNRVQCLKSSCWEVTVATATKTEYSKAHTKLTWIVWWPGKPFTCRKFHNFTKAIFLVCLYLKQ